MGAGPGRPKGKLNKLTLTMTEFLEESFQQLGGVKWLIKLGKEDRKAYAMLIARLSPTQVVAELTGKDGKDLFTPEQAAKMVGHQKEPK